jgi:hypothetical protein
MMTARTRPVCRYCGLRYRTSKHEPFCSKRCALNHEREVESRLRPTRIPLEKDSPTHSPRGAKARRRARGTLVYEGGKAGESHRQPSPQVRIDPRAALAKCLRDCPQ